MVARMMRWRPWPPLLQTKKFEVRLVVRRIEGLAAEGAAAVEIRWKGPQKMALSALTRRSAGMRRNRTRQEGVREGGKVDWDEEFFSVCALTAYKESSSDFHPWEISFAVLTGLFQGPKDKILTVGTTSLNLADFVSGEEKEAQLTVPLLVPGATVESGPTLYLAVSLLELRTVPESQETMQRSIVPDALSPPSSGALSSEQDEPSALRSGFRKVRILKDFVSNRKVKKTCPDDENGEGRLTRRNDNTEHETESTDNDLDDEEDRMDTSNFRNSFSYGSLVSANYIGGSFFSDLMINNDNDDLVYYSHRRSDVGCSHVEETTSSISELPVAHTLKRSILPWRKRKLSFKSPKVKGEPLLNKSYGEEGGDDIDFDRRQLSSSDNAILRDKGYQDSAGNGAALSIFGDDHFAVGSWESKEIVSRDGNMKLCTEVFFATIDQRSERAAGESACAVLVAVIADWFHANRDMMPIKCQFDNLIREGSLKWRNLCENQMYLQHFPDRHFDLETVLQAKICPLSVAPGKSFIGFFHPECTDDNSSFDFLHGAMSFDNIWDEISRVVSDSHDKDTPRIYVVSWNDHFFILKVEHDAYYIIDTLGERLHEGCTQAYILKFDESTLIQRVSCDSKPDTGNVQDAENQHVQQDHGRKESDLTYRQDCANICSEDEVVCRGKDSCKEYIKSFLAAIPIRELQVDLKKGLNSTSLHHRLQIEFHYTESSNEKSAELLTEAEPALTLPGQTESDSEFSLPTESDPENLASPCSAESAAEPFLPVESAASFFPVTPLNLEIEV